MARELTMFTTSTVIKIPLRKETQGVAMRARQKAALKTWDEDRARSGYGKWEMAFVGGGASTSSVNPRFRATNFDSKGLSMGTMNEVKYQVRQFADVFIPVPELARSKEESKEEWEERVSELFEWVGMACLGAQR